MWTPWHFIPGPFSDRNFLYIDDEKLKSDGASDLRHVDASQWPCRNHGLCSVKAPQMGIIHDMAMHFALPPEASENENGAA